jgi:hypothetical protein
MEKENLEFCVIKTGADASLVPLTHEDRIGAQAKENYVLVNKQAA